MTTLQLTTPVDIPAANWQIAPCERMLFVGSCFADEMGRRFTELKFRTVVNPYGVMYNPLSIGHTVRRLLAEGAMPFRKEETGTAIFTLGTNHIYILKETGEVVDNCQKRPQNLFEERVMSVADCAKALQETIDTLRKAYPKVRVILTVSPIRYRKYSYHGSQLSKAALLLAIDEVLGQPQNASDDCGKGAETSYFPAYEIINDELRDYRFYKADMLHPSDQAVDYICQRFAQTYFSPTTHDFLKAWEPIRRALAHRPFDAESEEYKRFMADTRQKAAALMKRYPDLDIDLFNNSQNLKK